jgi:hypothetical protein
MQEFADDQREQIKKLSKFDITKEEQFKRMGVEEFMFHLLILSESKDE